MPRFFIAVALPDEAKDRLGAVQPRGISGMRLIGREEMHLTLHFLGEVASENDEFVHKALASVKVNAFTITISRVGKFPAEGHANVLWAGIESSRPLVELHHAVGTALTAAIGFQPENRPYAPHVTLARLNMLTSSELVERYLEEHKDFEIAAIRLTHFVLFSSVLVDNVPLYRQEAVFPFIASASST